jgi:hypothetical protein
MAHQKKMEHFGGEWCCGGDWESQRRERGNFGQGETEWEVRVDCVG